jgi:hypothetical protein
MTVVVVNRLQDIIAQSSTGLAAKVDHQQWQSLQSGQAGASSAPATTAARRGTFDISVRTYTLKSRSS